MKAPNVNFKDILKKLSFLKNNLALLVPIIIAIVALLMLIPTHLVGKSLKAQIEEKSLRPGKRIGNLISDVNSASEAEAMQAYIDAYAADVNAINAMISHTSERELLRYDIFGPDTNETSRVLFERFATAYRTAIDTILENTHAGVCPTREEVQTALKSAPRTPMRMGGGYGPEMAYGGAGSPYGGGMDPFGGGLGRGQSLGIVTETDKKIVEQICLDRARSFSVYASPADVAGYAFWNDWEFEDKDKAYKDCWYWQVGYWILDDVFTSVQNVNQGAQSVLEAPIKRVMSAEFSLKNNRAAQGRRRGRRRQTKDTDAPTYAVDSSNVLTVPCTGRYSDPVDDATGIDVVQFDVRVIIDETQIDAFMQELCKAKPHKFRGFYGDQPEQTYEHNQITILETSLSQVERESYEHFLYRYGELPVVELDVICEYIFDRTPAFEEIKPKQVKDELRDEDEEDM